MDEKNSTLHYVCTRKEAWDLIEQHNRFWISDCGCRLAKHGCARSRIDLCLAFVENWWKNKKDKGMNLKEVSKEYLREIFQEAKEKHLVTRPFHNSEDLNSVTGICFCCDDCCKFFIGDSEKCNKGLLIEKTDLTECTSCGLCVEVCHFEARKIVNGGLTVDRDRCYGCGLCLDVCPIEKCIMMVPR